MRYIDSGVREAEQSVAWWMEEISSAGPCEFRCQAGYFNLDGASILLPRLKDWAEQGLPISMLLGSNGAVTLASHVAFLAGALGLPRPTVRISIASFQSSLFHPKVYHFVRSDGSQAAYVGSANLTGAGISGHNVEAGIIADTRDGDDSAILDEIRHRIDASLDGLTNGSFKIEGPQDIERLLGEGYLSVHRERTAPEADLGGPDEPGTPQPSRTRITPLYRLPKIESEAPAGIATEASGTDRTRFLRHTEASYHYPQGTHLGHILAILMVLSGNREGTPFDDDFIRLTGSLGNGRIAGFRRQIKYKLLAAMELGLVSDIRFLEDSTAFIPSLTDLGALLWQRIGPAVSPNDLVLGEGREMSTKVAQRPSFYNDLIRTTRERDPQFRDAYDGAVLGMPAVQQMIEFLGRFPEDRISKGDIYRGFFAFPAVLAFCDEMGVEPQTVESARHRCPFLLNILESLDRIEQDTNTVLRK